MKNFTLSNNLSIPAIGFGTYKSTDGLGEKVIIDAIAEGYRHFDTASAYENEEEVGRGIQESGIDRNELFLTTKIWRDDLGYESTIKSLENSCKKLQTETIDLLLIHWPTFSNQEEDSKEAVIQTWKAMEDLYESQKVKSIGVSNFLPHHMRWILDTAKIIPMVNQLEFHPGYIQKTAIDFSKEQGMLVEAWSPIGRRKLFEEQVLIKMAEKYHVSIARLCVRFALQCGILPLPKSSAKERMKENLDVFSFKIEEDDMSVLLTLPQIGWSGEHPDRKRLYV